MLNYNKRARLQFVKMVSSHYKIVFKIKFCETTECVIIFHQAGIPLNLLIISTRIIPQFAYLFCWDPTRLDNFCTSFVNRHYWYPTRPCHL